MDDEPNCEINTSVSISGAARSQSTDPTWRSSLGESMSAADAAWTGIIESMTRSVSLALERHNIRVACVCITVVTDEEIAALNTQYLGHDGPTDVLSFDLAGPRSGAVQRPTCAGPDEHADGGKTIEGDIVVSLGTAAREARTRGHSLANELALYAVHGTLHLLGYDDRRPADARRMHELEDELLVAAGIGRIYGVRSE